MSINNKLPIERLSEKSLGGLWSLGFGNAQECRERSSTPLLAVRKVWG
jgi:hypothetical protein